ncbi:hypothetical protein EZV73_06965 [Acidaminobacter sp. JC074]|uniref:complex I subunit 5 family protein n=1 Tax=Acidaminobacter sp. JC074 TaxID=2530199 RepID=UPI001F0FC542|nr:proton-conducting transporter membrane subunit [Acidaminobacter sp. JC074]MCH4887305.1 hypothetical protein [Acidaminobacter sp. JC074]
MNQFIFSQILIFTPILISVLIYTFSKPWVSYLAFLAQSIITLVMIEFWQYSLTQGVLKFTLGGWSKMIGIEFKIDNLSLIFMTMATIVWWVILIYAWQQKKNDYKFLFFLMFLEGCFLALVQVNDFFTLFVLIEVITIISSILIIYKKDGISLRAGLYYLLFNSIGMTLYLFGVALIYLKVGTLNMSLIKAQLIGQEFMAVDYSIIQVSFACFFVSMCVKAAMFPVYEWLPRAHTAAPSYISALLSSLLVKTGVFGLIRILDVYRIVDVYPLIFYLGCFTTISGIIFTISQNDIKGILAFSTISQIGFILMGIGANSDIGMTGAYLQILNHFVFKSLLFLGAGIIINDYGVRRVTEIRGVFKSHTVLSICMVIGLLSITGAPYFIGFISKSMIKLSIESQLQLNLFRIVSLGSIISYMKFAQIFFGEPVKRRRKNKGQHFSVIFMTSLCIALFFLELEILAPILSINDPVSSDVIKSIAYIKKSFSDGYYLLEYLIYFVIGFVVYKLFIKPNDKVMHYIRHFRISFQDAIVSLLVFLVLVIQYL